MKKTIFILIICVAASLMVNAQKESGVVYSEHEAINKTKALWAAFAKGDKETYLSYFTDTISVISNGSLSKKLNKDFGKMMDWWMGVENLVIKDDTPATPDAILYKNGELWVQDWLRATGIHKETGVVIDFAFNNGYRFDKNGKIDMIVQFFNPEIFREVNNSTRTIENGTVYINHPYIVAVRKLVNAYCAEDVEALKSFYSPKARFWVSNFKPGKTNNLDEQLAGDKQFFDECSNIVLKQFGYPDCVYYAKGDGYIVYSWWMMSFTTKDGTQKKDIAIHLVDMFDKEGKVYMEVIYPSSNLFE